MKTKGLTLTAVIAVILGVMVVANGCLEKKVIEIVVTDETFADITEDEQDVNYASDVTLNYGDEIDKILEDNGYSRDQIKKAKLISAAYEVIDFPNPPHDWEISGQVTGTRDDQGGSALTILTHSGQSVMAALNNRTKANIDPAGRAMLDQALQDFIDGQNPVITFSTDGTVNPAPTPSDPMMFTWRVYLVVQVITEKEPEVPDPF